MDFIATTTFTFDQMVTPLQPFHLLKCTNRQVRSINLSNCFLKVSIALNRADVDCTGFPLKMPSELFGAIKMAAVHYF